MFEVIKLLNENEANCFARNLLFIGNGQLNGYTMYHVSNFPGIIEDCNDYMLGELYEINDGVLEALDLLEAEGFMYSRIEEEIELQKGINFRAFVYKWIQDYDPELKVRCKPWKPIGLDDVECYF